MNRTRIISISLLFSCIVASSFGCHKSVRLEKEISIKQRYNVLEYSLPGDEYGDVVFCDDFLVANYTEYSEEYEIALENRNNSSSESPVPVNLNGEPVYPKEYIDVFNIEGQQKTHLFTNKDLPKTHLKRQLSPEKRGVWVLSTCIEPLTGEVRYVSSLMQPDGRIIDEKRLFFETFYYVDEYVYSENDNHIVVGTNENGEEHLLMFSSNGQCIADHEISMCSVVDLISHKGEIVLLCNSQSDESYIYMLVVGEDGSLPDNSIRISSDNLKTYEEVKLYSQADCLYAYNSSAIYKYNEEKHSFDTLLKWIDTDSTISVRTVSVNQQEEISIYGYSYVSKKPTLGILSPADSSLPPKKTIYVGGYALEQFPAIMTLIYQANYSSTEYHYVIKDYSDNPNGDIREAVFLDIMNGNAPDIYIEQEYNYIPFYDLSTSDYLCDLSSFVDSLSDEEYFKDLISIGQDHPFCVAAFVRPNALFGLSSEIDGYQWDFSRYMDCLGEMENGQQFQSVLTAEDLLYYSLFSCMDKFVDIEKPTCRFDNEDFRELLEWSKMCGIEEPSGNIYSRMKEKELLLSYTDHISFKEMIINEWSISEPVSYIGFPAAGGNSISYFHDFTMGISAQSQYKNECMRFLSMAFDKDFQIEYRHATNSVSKIAEREIAKQEWEELSNTLQLTDFDYYFSRYADCLSRVEAPVFGSFEIMNIINEEVPAYFQNQKPIDDVQSIIQKRVKLYLQEQYG